MSSNGQYPDRVEMFNGHQVTLYEIDGKEYLTAEDLGICLGMADPGRTINKLYRRNQDELEPHTTGDKLSTVTGLKDARFFDETGCNLIAMFSRTAKAKTFRKWLAQLPRKVRQLVNGEAMRQAFARGLEQGLAMIEALPLDLAADEVGQIIVLRQNGFTQQEVAAVLGSSRDHVKQVEKLLKERGLEFEAVRHGPRRKRFRAVTARALCGARQIHPGSPLPKGGEVEAGGDARPTSGLLEAGHEPSAR